MALTPVLSSLYLPFQAEDKKATLPAGLSAAEKADAHEEEELRAAEERIQSLMTTMTAMANEESRLTASSVGQIVGLCSAEIKQIVSEYAEKQSELSAEESPETLGTSQLHHRKVISLNKQILQKTKHLEEVGCVVLCLFCFLVILFK
ncbi:coiled-coil domain-containing protein 93-like isoform X2 [Ochotona curzoniae]|uniref:coiled-coil domain-containing protein 93-like isoform X2 n=1 Tax=Ochotona curzoniae TaxID=130825 RepID=UPI001B34E5AF|nr:coiled-coil domain-containing protein 93-like isoform X2 [Ochotona curzoniae]